MASFHRLGAQDVVEVMTIGLFVDPSSNRGKHVSMDFDMLIAQGWVVKDAKYVSHDFVDWNSWVLPCIENTTRVRQYRDSLTMGTYLRSNVLQNCGSNSSSYRV